MSNKEEQRLPIRRYALQQLGLQVDVIKRSEAVCAELARIHQLSNLIEAPIIDEFSSEKTFSLSSEYNHEQNTHADIVYHKSG